MIQKFMKGSRKHYLVCVTRDNLIKKMDLGDFANVNTSRKAIIGTLFISKVKDILEELGTPKNDLPILFDKLESISLKTFEDNKQVFELTNVLNPNRINNNVVFVMLDHWYYIIAFVCFNQC